MPSPGRTSTPSAIQRLFAAIFSPPFRGLPVLVWVYFVWCFLVYPHSWILQGNLPDSDDYMYLDQVLDWLKGQRWFDNVQHRLDPPAGTLIVFSRLTELPMAVLVAVLSPLLGMSKAALAVAAIVPPALFALLLIALRWAAEPFMDKDWTRVTAFIALFASYLVFQFSPGHIDHHGLTALLVIVGFGFAARMIEDPAVLKWPLGAGVALGFALVVGLEILPPLILISGWIGLWAMAQGGKAARSALAYGLALFLASALFLAITSPAREWFVFDPLRFSAVYVLFTASIASCLAGVALAAQTRFAAFRYVAGSGLALMAGIFYLKTFPALIAGPYGAMNPDLKRLMFTSITEALPVIKIAANPVAVFLYLIWPVMGSAAAVWFLRGAGRKRKQDRWLWGMAVLVLAVSILLGTFYQIRFMVFAQLFCVIPMTAVLHRGMIWAGKNCKGRALGLMELGLLLLAAPLPMLVLPAAIDNRPFNTGIFLFPVATASYECDMQSVARELNRRNLPGARPVLVMNEMESGPELMFRTPHDVLAAPFHTDVNGNLDAARFFSAAGASDGLAQGILRRRAAKLVLLCRKMVPLYHRPDGEKTLAERLDAGDIPSWLKPIHYPDEQDYLLFETSPAAKDDGADSIPD